MQSIGRAAASLFFASILLAACAGSPSGGSDGGSTLDRCGTAGDTDAGPNLLDEVNGTVYTDVSLNYVSDAAAFLLGDPARPSGVVVVLSSLSGICAEAQGGMRQGDATLFTLFDTPDAGADAGVMSCGEFEVDPGGASGLKRFVELEWIDEECMNARGGDSTTGTIELNVIGPDRVQGYFSVQTKPLDQYGPATYDLSGDFDAPVCNVEASVLQQWLSSGHLAGCD